MRLIPSDDPSIIKFTKNLGEVLVLCETGLSLYDDCPGIYMSRPEFPMNIYPVLLDYFDINPLLLKSKRFSFFVGKKLILREIRGYEEVLQLVDRQYNMLELKMKPNIEDILRRKKLLHVQRRIKAKRNNTIQAVTKKNH
jgi:hypothetical protein